MPEGIVPSNDYEIKLNKSSFKKGKDLTVISSSYMTQSLKIFTKF